MQLAEPNVDCHLSALLRSNDIISADNHNFADNSAEISAGFSGYRSCKREKVVINLPANMRVTSIRRSEWIYR